MITLHVVEHDDHWHIWKDKTNKNEKKKEKFYEKSTRFGELVYIIEFLGTYYPNFNYWKSYIQRGKAKNTVKVKLGYR